MILQFTHEAWLDYIYWRQNDRKLTQRINALIKDAMRDPFTGIGKPEPMKHGMKGY